MVAFIHAAAIRTLVPHAACFVVLGAALWDEFLRERGSPEQDWRSLEVRTSAAKLILEGAASQEVLDCLHEGIAQALGPLNDLYRPHDSVCNDDNIGAVLTDSDMLVLKIHYAPELRSSMTRAEVAARLPEMLNWLNPDGERQALEGSALPQSWTRAIGLALSTSEPGDARRYAAEAAVAVAGHGAAKCLAFLALGRTEVAGDPGAAEATLTGALAIFDSRPAMGIQATCARLQLAGLALSRGDVASGVQPARERRNL